MSKLIINEEPLLVLPSLAKSIGLNEAVFLQQIHYWLNRSNHFYDERRWIYNSAVEWSKQFPFWSEKTIRRILKNLEETKILLTGNYNKMKFDKTKWYTIDYDKLRSLETVNDVDNLTRRSGKSDHVLPDKLTRPIPENTQRLSTEITEYIVEIVNYLNTTCNKSYRTSTKKTQTLIKARLAEGYTVEQFKKVIDIKKSHWFGDAKWDEYLRPETLFGTKFESYLNSKPKTKQHSEMSAEERLEHFQKEAEEQDDLPF
ncbi:conserved phage C-terminal domain-containing protein [Bacillus thuringiensis]|uniref:Replication protein O n=1 Tax=Bacillus thuringiensis subsp. tolworthi TaxID=1442 RepID=A0A9W4ES67_BACTO|nr:MULTISPECIES: conserved phage C-terminal domain-containing protein [Bacillus cereus group]MDA2638418.1 conserved phage C-terminal domain-containing protein [Bacillus cereus]KAB5660835.1 replication protein [Bacillus thuringiensis]MEB8711752.1 conserved phage C-terminal domain-containing protein [Bacillus cereus]MEB9592216.1 conserved phage C-terminal domain-containing protein [Bacillus cereus]MED2754642.1 conserved phage C-terminal domain-containing protein [Bacillus thuringiensis]